MLWGRQRRVQKGLADEAVCGRARQWHLARALAQTRSAGGAREGYFCSASQRPCTGGRSQQAERSLPTLVSPGRQRAGPCWRGHREGSQGQQDKGLRAKLCGCPAPLLAPLRGLVQPRLLTRRGETRRRLCLENKGGCLGTLT